MPKNCLEDIGLLMPSLSPSQLEWHNDPLWDSKQQLIYQQENLCGSILTFPLFLCFSRCTFLHLIWGLSINP